MLAHQYLEYHARMRPDVILLAQDDRSISYLAFDRLANQVANGLKSLGVASNDRIGIIGHNSIDFLAMVIGAFKLGAVAVPINWRLAPQEWHYIIGDAELRALFINDGEFLTAAGLVRDGYPDLPIIGSEPVALSGYEVWADWLADQSSGHPGQSPHTPGDVCLQLYTSGTTGNPKGALLSHANIQSYLPRHLVALGRDFGCEVELVCAPMFHIAGLGSVLFSAMMGTKILLEPAFDPIRVVDKMVNEKVSQVFMVPAMIKLVLDTIDGIDAMDFSNLQRIYYGASPIAPALLRQAMAVFKCDFLQAYGMTETCGTVVHLTAADHEKALNGREDLLLSCGRAGVDTQVQIVDLDGNVLPPRQTGEICVKSPAVTRGYWKLPDATAEAIQNGWIHTGDAGYMDEEGYIYLLDRIKDMVVTGGENVYPVEVEKALIQHPAIHDVAVIGVPDEKYGEALAAIVVAEPDSVLEVDDMIAFCRPLIAGYKIPRILKPIDEIPRNPSGKILKTELRKMYPAL